MSLALCKNLGLFSDKAFGPSCERTSCFLVWSLQVTPEKQKTKCVFSPKHEREIISMKKMIDVPVVWQACPGHPARHAEERHQYK